MADFPKALKHHGMAGKALKSGNSRLAAHHFGHAMSALRTSAMPGVVASKRSIPPMAPAIEGGEPDDADTPVKPPSTVRNILARFRSSGGGM